MPLTTDEAFDNAIALLQDLKAAIQEGSDGGKTITTKEIIQLAAEFLSQLGIDVID